MEPLARVEQRLPLFVHPTMQYGSDRGERSADGADAIKKSQKTFHGCKICNLRVHSSRR